jgi:hypothetical protein
MSCSSAASAVVVQTGSVLRAGLCRRGAPPGELKTGDLAPDQARPGERMVLVTCHEMPGDDCERSRSGHRRHMTPRRGTSRGANARGGPGLLAGDHADSTSRCRASLDARPWRPRPLPDWRIVGCNPSWPSKLAAVGNRRTSPDYGDHRESSSCSPRRRGQRPQLQPRPRRHGIASSSRRAPSVGRSLLSSRAIQRTSSSAPTWPGSVCTPGSESAMSSSGSSR